MAACGFGNFSASCQLSKVFFTCRGQKTSESTHPKERRSLAAFVFCGIVPHLPELARVKHGAAVGDETVQHALQAAHVALVRGQAGEGQGRVGEAAVLLREVNGERRGGTLRGQQGGERARGRDQSVRQDRQERGTTGSARDAKIFWMSRLIAQCRANNMHFRGVANRDNSGTQIGELAFARPAACQPKSETAVVYIAGTISCYAFAFQNRRRGVVEAPETWYFSSSISAARNDRRAWLTVEWKRNKPTSTMPSSSS